MVKGGINFTLPEPECNRTGTGNDFNLMIRMTVLNRSVLMMRRF